jgi:hypothetical protein
MNLNRFVKWFSTPQSTTQIDKGNFVNVQIDAIGVGLASAAAPFLPVYLTRLGASTFEVGLLTSMPALTGLLLSIPLGQYLQRQKNIVPVFSKARLLVILSYTLTGLLSFFLFQHSAVVGILGVWALATIPQTLLAISFTVVMSKVAGPVGRYELMTRRWSILGLTTTITVLILGQVLDRIAFPLNYQMMFLLLSMGGLISYYFSSHIRLSDSEYQPSEAHNVRERVSEYVRLILSEKPFVSFVMKRFVFLLGTTLAAPLFPVYFVRILNAPDSWIANINIAQTAILIIGYFVWTRTSRRRVPRIVLLITTFGISFYPLLTAVSSTYYPIPLYAGMAGIFQAGLNLVFFDELMKRVPVNYSATFVSAAQSLQYVSSVIAPFLGTFIADQIGFTPALITSSCISLIGFVLFLTEKKAVRVTSEI